MSKLLEQDLENAQNLINSDKYKEAIPSLHSIISSHVEANDEVNKIREEAILTLASLYRNLGLAAEIKKLSVDLRPFFNTFPQAKVGKIVRALIDEASKIPNAVETVIELCKDSIVWTENEGRTFLRLYLETKLAESYFEVAKYQDALGIIRPLLREVKKLDDKRLLVSIHLLESRIHHALRHIPKARAALTASRTAANAIYCPPQLQAELDMQSGTLHAEEGDYKTAYSYFYEAFENYESLSAKEAQPKLSKLCLKYMLLTKIMAGGSDEVSVLISGKLALQFADEEISSMLQIAKAYQEASLRKFKETIEIYKQDLEKDSVIHIVI